MDRLAKYLTLFVGGSAFLYSVLVENTGLILLNSSALINVVLIFITRKQKNIAFFFTFTLFYLTYQYPYYVKGIRTAGYLDFDNLKYYMRVLYVHHFFLWITLFFIAPIKHTYSIKKRLTLKKNPVVFWSTQLLLILFPLLGSRGAGLGGLALFEYGIIFILIGYKFSKGIYKREKILIITSLYYCLFSVLMGGRIETLQVILLLSIIIFDLSKLNYSHILPFIFIGFYTMLLLGQIRNNLAQVNPLQVLSSPLEERIIRLEGKQIIYSHHGDVYYASARMIGLIDIGELSTRQRIESFIGNVFSIFLPSKFLPAHVNLGSYKQYKYGSGGGGLFSIYFFSFLGYLGVILSAFWISYLINQIRKSQNQFFLLYVVLVLSTYPRWWAYNPITMFKLCFWIIPIYFLLLRTR